MKSSPEATVVFKQFFFPILFWNKDGGLQIIIKLSSANHPASSPRVLELAADFSWRQKKEKESSSLDQNSCGTSAGTRFLVLTLSTAAGFHVYV